MNTVGEFLLWLLIMSVIVGTASSVQEAHKMGVSYLDFWRHWRAEVRYHTRGRR